MRIYRLITLAASALIFAACNPFHVGQAVQMSAQDVNLNARWHGNIASPATLAGAVQMTGEATMAPGSNAGNTTVTLDVANATPGGRHPWALPPVEPRPGFPARTPAKPSLSGER